jgi:hypothetical protein
MNGVDEVAGRSNCTFIHVHGIMQRDHATATVRDMQQNCSVHYRHGNESSHSFSNTMGLTSYHEVRWKWRTKLLWEHIGIIYLCKQDEGAAYIKYVFMIMPCPGKCMEHLMLG